MGRQRITRTHQAVNVFTNTPGVPTPILQLTVPNRTRYTLVDGTVLNLKLFDNVPTEIDTSSLVIFGGLLPNQIVPTEIDSWEYDVFSALTITQQQDERNQGRLKIAVNGGTLTFYEQHSMIIMLQSPDLIEWTESTISFDVQENRQTY